MIVATINRADTHLIFVTSQNDPDNVVGRALNFMSHRMYLDKVKSFEEALNIAKETAPGPGHVPIMLLIDLQLPHQDRSHFTAKLKNNKTTKNIPVIGLADPYSRDRPPMNRDNGINAIVPMKRDPMEYQELSETITEYWFSNDFISLPV